MRFYSLIFISFSECLVQLLVVVCTLFHLYVCVFISNEHKKE